MVNWMQAWWQARQSWSFVYHAYCYTLQHSANVDYADVIDAWSHRCYAMAYAVAQVTPSKKLNPVSYR